MDVKPPKTEKKEDPSLEEEEDVVEDPNEVFDVRPENVDSSVWLIKVTATSS